MLLILLIAIASTEKISAQIKEKQCRNDSSQSVFRAMARIMWQLKVHEKMLRFNGIVLCHAQTLSVEIKAKSRRTKYCILRISWKYNKLDIFWKSLYRVRNTILAGHFFSHLRPQYIRKDTKK